MHSSDVPASLSENRPTPEQRRAHVALVNIGLHGHVIPTLAVARELVARGHRVSYAVPDSFVPMVAETGAVPVGYRSAWRPDDDSLKLLTDFTAIVSYMLDEAENALPQLRNAFADDRPDVFLYDVFAYEARVLAHQWAVPSVNFWPFAVPYDGKDNGIAAVYAGLRRDAATEKLRDRFTRWLSGEGITMPLDEFGLRPERGIASLTRDLQPHADKVDDSVFTFVGPCFGERAGQGDWRPPRDARRILLISLGSTFTNRPDFYRRCVAEFAGTDWHVVLQTGKFVDPELLGEVPENIEVHQWLPQLQVLEHATAFVTHAGMGGTVEALHHGVPMLALPQGADQFFIADRLVELGVAQRFDHAEAAGLGLRAAVEGVLDLPGIQQRLARLQMDVRASGGAVRAADVVESRLR